MNKDRRLGRGLEALLGRPFDSEASPDSGPQPAAPSAGSESPLRVAAHLIDSNPYQPRREFDEQELQALADSVSEYGLLQPLVVRPAGDRFQLIAGERRLRAAQRLGLPDVPVHLVEADDRRMSEIAIVENLQRQDLNAIEKAEAFARYLATYQVRQEDLAARLKIDRSTVSNLIRLLELPESVRDAVRRGAISSGHARALLPLGEAREQVAFCERIQRDGLSVRATEAQVGELIRNEDREPLAMVGGSGNTVRAQPRSEQLSALEQEIRQALGTKVELHSTPKHRGRIVIHFANLGEFDRLRQVLCGTSRVQSQAG